MDNREVIMENNLILRKPSIDEFNKWFQESCLRQADDRAFSNKSSKEFELERLKEMVKVLLPEGMNTKNHFFWVLDSSILKNIGFIWFGRIPDFKEDESLLLDIMIKKSERGKGYGKYLLCETQRILKSYGYKKIILNVMDRNPAKHLYESLGYKVIQSEEDHKIMSLNI